jgi:O-acetylhomoserine/O-acetylserine sulfhydrylase-like pyridoxal-dependent enzyme
MGSNKSAENVKRAPATIAVHGGEQTDEQQFGDVGFSDEQLEAAGVSAATVRFSLGIEAAEDIITDITQALSGI